MFASKALQAKLSRIACSSIYTICMQLVEGTARRAEMPSADEVHS